MAKGRRCLDGQSWEVAAMATAETVMTVYSDRGKRGLPLEGVYRQLYSRDLYLNAYGRIHRNDGAMTPGVTAETVDAMSLEKIDGIIDALRREAYRWSPVRRTYIPKKNGKKCPPGRTNSCKRFSVSCSTHTTNHGSAITPTASAEDVAVTRRCGRSPKGGGA